MNIVDSCGWLEYFADGPNASFFSKPLENPDSLLVPTICLLEVFKRIYIQRGEASAIEAVSVMQQCSTVALDSDIALYAAKISSETKLPLADSVILATARLYKAVIWTQDSDFKQFKEVRYVEKESSHKKLK